MRITKFSVLFSTNRLHWIESDGTEPTWIGTESFRIEPEWTGPYSFDYTRLRKVIENTMQKHKVFYIGTLYCVYTT